MVFLTRILRKIPHELIKAKSLSDYLTVNAGFYKYGLMRDDMIHEYDPIVEEALRRLPEKLRDERNFRISKALLVNANHRILPKEEWMTLDKDVRYLTPYIELVEQEFKEKEDWEESA